MNVLDRFLGYIAEDTTSSERAGTHPSTAAQLHFAARLTDEMSALGLSDVRRTDTGYVYGTLPATEGFADAPALGFIAHMDTSPSFCGKDIHPRVIRNYDGKDVELGGGRVLRTEKFPHLPGLAGRTLITTDGTTLLGADDKAGIAEILTLAEELITRELPHGKLCFAITPDEEIGEGADGFDVPGFGADFAYTCDGDAEGGIEYENFNASEARFLIHGFDVHPGAAKGRMINALAVACEINAMLPPGETPRDTEGREGFFHLTTFQGTTSKALIRYIVRDHDAARYEQRRQLLEEIAAKLNEKYGAGTVELRQWEQYRNMAEKIAPHMHLIETAKDAARAAGVEPLVSPIRGGTDGARLSYMGLPCPNLGTGGHAFHGPYEHITLEGMQLSIRILHNITAHYAHCKKGELV